MKPRLPVAPLTPEDEAIWCRLLVSSGDGLWFVRLVYRDVGFGNDRRDADLMYLARLWRCGQMVMGHTYAHSGPCGRFAIDAIRCGGDITGCV